MRGPRKLTASASEFVGAVNLAVVALSGVLAVPCTGNPP